MIENILGQKLCTCGKLFLAFEHNQFRDAYHCDECIQENDNAWNDPRKFDAPEPTPCDCCSGHCGDCHIDWEAREAETHKPGTEVCDICEKEFKFDPFSATEDGDNVPDVCPSCMEMLIKDMCE